MSKVTKKLQVSIPKVLADAVGIRPGDDLLWENADGVLRAYTEHNPMNRPDVVERLRRFDETSARQAVRDRSRWLEAAMDRGWSREDLYTR